jgi:polar amino acid transport system substrate-binding protein
MPKQLHLLTMLLFSFAVDSIYADDHHVIMATSDGPPYMIQATQSGLDVDIPRAALNAVDIPLKLTFYPLARALHELKAKRIQLTAPFFTSPPEGIYVSEPHIEYRPSVISLNDISKLESIRALKDYSIATFQGATGYFGKDFHYASENSPDYVEYHDMGKLVDLLMKQRYQVIVLDYWIFQHYLAQSPFAKEKDKVVYHDLIPRVPAAVAFTDSELRDRFNQGLELIKKDGTYQQIINHYHRY